MRTAIRAACVLAVVSVALTSVYQASSDSIALSPATLVRVGRVDDRFQSYNVEMIEVTGGRFWKPYANTQQSTATPAPRNPDLYEYRRPIDLTNIRLRNLAAGLGPAYVRVSGTWANSVYFHDADEPPPPKPPAGFNGVLTRQQWKAVIDFARAADARLMTSFAFGAGTRDATGAWTPAQARRLVAFTEASGGRVDAAEFTNEPNFAAMGGAPPGYDAAMFGRDITTFKRFLREASPKTLFLGPGSTGEGGALDSTKTPGRLRTDDLLQATGPVYDVFSYHIYAAISQRCAGGAPALGTTREAARTKEWLSRPDAIHRFYAALRDKYEPGKPLWVTETADAACGGNPWASTFLDTFRYLDQLGRLAKHGVQLVAHNTLAASDYGLLDEKTLAPRPNYWAALLWRRLMGSVVLDPGTAQPEGLYAYSHCMRDRPGGVTVLAINAGTAAADLEVPIAGERYTLTAPELESASVRLNGTGLQVGSDGVVPRLGGAPVPAGHLSLAPASITFLAFPSAGNNSCR